MTRYDFARHFRTVCNVLGVWEYDEPDADAAALDAAAARVWKLWLIPSLFDGFDPADWRLSDDERATMQAQVGLYREAAEGWHCRGGDPTAADVAKARVAFRQVYRAIGSRLYHSENLPLLRDLHRIVLHPPDEGFRRWVRGVDIRFDTDFDGDPVIGLTLIVPDDALDDEQFWTEWRAIRWPLKKRALERVTGPEHVSMTLAGEDELAARMMGVAA